MRLEDRPWSEFRLGRPITPPQLAATLRPFGVRSATIRIGNETAKGYYREALTEAWERYLPPVDIHSPGEGWSEPSQRHNAGNSKPPADFRAVTRDGRVTPQKSRKPPQNLACDGVTACNPLYGEKGGSPAVWSEVL